MSNLFGTYLVVTALAVAANLFAAGADLARHPRIVANMDRAGVPRSWMIPLGIAKAAGGLGLLAGVFVPPIGIAAGVGLVLFFVGAYVTHLRARFYDVTAPIVFLALAVAALVLRLAVSGGAAAPGSF